MRSITLTLLLAILAPTLVLAAPTQSPIVLDNNTLPEGPNSVLFIVNLIADWFFTILLVLAVFFFLLAAYNYLGGNEEKVEKAHRMLMFTAVAIAVALLAIGIASAITKLVRTPTSSIDDPSLGNFRRNPDLAP